MQVALTDPAFETAVVLRLFLLLISEGEIEKNYWLPHTHHLVTFIRKWDCPIALKHLLLLLQTTATSGRASPLRVFAIAAAAESRTVCATVLRSCVFRCELDADTPQTDDWQSHGGESLNPARFPMYMWTDVPPMWSMALARTYNEAKHCIDMGHPTAYYANTFLGWLDKLQDANATDVACANLPSRFDLRRPV
jgi:hypothetical protein